MPGHHRNNHRQDPTAATKATPCRTLPIVFPTIGRFLFGEERESAHPSTRSGNGSARAGLLRPRPPCGSTSLHIHRKAGIAGRPSRIFVDVSSVIPLRAIAARPKPGSRFASPSPCSYKPRLFLSAFGRSTDQDQDRENTRVCQGINTQVDQAAALASSGVIFEIEATRSRKAAPINPSPRSESCDRQLVET